MKYTYEENAQYNVVIRTDKDGIISSIPMDEGNSDYQRYLRWLENPDADEAQSL